MSTAETEIKSKAKVHTVYKTADGTRVPSVTTILGELAKPALVPWAWKLGTQGIDWKTYRDSLADVGTLTHAMILAHLKGETPEPLLADYPPEQSDAAQNCFLSYLNWASGHDVKPTLIETPMVSEDFQYGGTFDFFGEVDGALTLMDFKTGKDIYPEHFYQLAGYANLLEEAKIAWFIDDTGFTVWEDKQIKRFSILNIPRAETEAFNEKVKSKVNAEWDVFLAARNIYFAKKRTEK